MELDRDVGLKKKTFLVLINLQKEQGNQIGPFCQLGYCWTFIAGFFWVSVNQPSNFQQHPYGHLQKPLV